MRAVADVSLDVHESEIYGLVEEVKPGHRVACHLMDE